MDPRPQERPKTPQAVFDRVAPYYDTINSLLSLGIDRAWRRATSAALGLRPGARVLDVATGTGALASALAKAAGGDVSVIGCDLNERMLAVARRRITRARLAIELVSCDATRLPFRDQSFDAATLAFAIDDMPDREACARELHRVLRPGGQLALLELSQPDVQPLKGIYQLYLKSFRMLRGFRVHGYDHLAQEILSYRGADAIRELLHRNGFSDYVRQSLSGGIARLHLARSGAPAA